MSLINKETEVRSVLSKSGIPGVTYCINPYTGCSHACRYCYATFMKRFSGHTEPWGSFVDVKTNAPEVLRRQLKRAEKGEIIISSVTDPYQPAEAEYRITRKCLEVIGLYQFPVSILTKSPLVIRDLDIILQLHDCDAGITITTDNDSVRKVFEPKAPSIDQRLDALRRLHQAGISTYVFIGPVLPMKPEALAEKIAPYAGRIIIDRMNYVSKTYGLFKRHGWLKWLDDQYISEVVLRLQNETRCNNIEVC